MQILKFIFLAIISFVFSLFTGNFLKLVDKKKAEDFKISEYLKEFRILNASKVLFGMNILLGIIFSIILPFKFVWIYELCIVALTMVFYTDYKYQIIPDTASIIIAICGILNLIMDFSLSGLISSACGGVVGFLFFLVINIISKQIIKENGFGFGDVKLYGALGLFFGIYGIVTNIVLTVFICAMFSIVFLIYNKLKKKKEKYLPFGPFICISSLILLVIPAESIVNWYFSIMDVIIDKMI